MTQASDYVEQIAAMSREQHPDEVIAYYGVGKDCTRVVEGEIVSEHRWHNTVMDVYRCADGSHFAAYHDEPATEMQETEPNPLAELVEPREVTVTKYFPVGKS